MAQRDMVAKYINDFGSITSWQAFADLGITRLSARIWELKRDGYFIAKERKETLNRYGKKVFYDKYTITGQIGGINESVQPVH